MPDNPAKHLLILGGTAEARELARQVSLMLGKRVRVTTSLAGRRASTPALGGDVRIGGFGGIVGLSEYLAETPSIWSSTPRIRSAPSFPTTPTPPPPAWTCPGCRS